MIRLFRNTAQKLQQRSVYETDIHSHLIPGIDDGVKTVEEAVLLIQEMYALGFTKLITTPHIRGEIYENNHEIIMSGLEHVRKALIEKNIPVVIEAAAEYYVDDSFQELIHKKSPLMTFSKYKHLLIEFSHFNLPMNYKTIIYELQSMGYTVVLAHPERYYYFQKRPEIFRDLYSRGVQMQLNLVSLTGYYDRAAMKTAEELIKLGFYSFAGSDVHNKVYLQACQKAFGLRSYAMLNEKCNIMNDML
jgi:protein-tyrosine phosphatase